MLLDMAPGSQAPAASFQNRCRVTAALLLIICVTLTKSAPTTYDEIEAKQTDLAEYLNNPNGCYYNYQHYEEGDRIVTNEPCLNCTCHNRMLMCYLRVCPFSKAIGQDCTVQKTPDQCCPTISCPEVPVHLLTSSTTQPTTTTTTTTTIGWHDSSYGCLMNENEFFPDGAQVPIDPSKPCELCYCIRNRTACVIQECTLHVEGCRPVYHDGVCCPVRYDCDYEIEKSTTTTPQISGGLVFTTTSAPSDCRVNDEVYTDGESITTDKPCEHCYCMRGNIVCVFQDCGEPLRGKDCTPETPPAGQCCPTSYHCANETTTDSYSITTLQPASQSDTDENEAEKHPSHDDVFDKLGEKLPESEQDDTNDIPDSEHAYTTPAATNGEILPVGISDQTGDTNEDSVAGSPDAAAVEGTTVLPTDDGVNKINNGENLQDGSVVKPDSPSSISPVSSTESDATKVASTENPVESTSSVDGVQQQTQPPTADSSVNENAASPTASTTSDENNAVPANGGSSQNEKPVENPSQDDIASNSPVVTTENAAVESETQSSNIQDKPQEQTNQQQTDAPSAIEKEPSKSTDDEQTPAQQSDVKPEITTDKIQEPPKESDADGTDSLNKIQTNVPSNDDIEQTTQQLTQQETENNTPLEETNAQTNSPTNIIQDSPNLSNQFTTQTSQNDNAVTESSSNAGPNAQNNVKPQEENVSPTEIPKVGNELAGQNQLPVDNKPTAENQSEPENTSTEQNQDSSQKENASPTEIPKVENEPIEQNKPLVDINPQTENQPESQKIPTEQNQDSAQAENLSPTEIPKVENQNKLQEENTISPAGLPGIENQDGTQEANVPSTDVPKVENEPPEQNKPIAEVNPQTENQPEKIPTEQNQDGTQKENVSSTEVPKGEDQTKPQAESASSTEIPKVENEPTEQNKPLVSENSQTGNQPESDITATEPNSQDNSHLGNEFSTEIPKVENEPVEQNKPPLADSVQGSENQPESGNKPLEQNQDGAQIENASSTDIPKAENEPTEQSKPVIDVLAEQNNKQDSTESQNVSPTEIPKVENNNAEQNKFTVGDHKPQTENQPESENTSTESINQDRPQLENESSTEIPKVENEPTEKNKLSTENANPVTENQSEWNKTPTEPNNQDSPQVEDVSPTNKPKVENEPVEQNKPALEESGSQSEDEPESQNTPTEKNKESSQTEVVYPTDVPKVEDGPAEQNKPLVESPQSTNQPESQNTPTEKNQDSPQAENVSPTEIPKVENEPVEQNKPLVDTNPQAENQPESQNVPVKQSQDSAQVENVSPTDIPTKLSEPQSENVSPINQGTPIVSENDVPTEQPINDNNIFIVTSTSPPLTSQNQVKDKESTSELDKNKNSETEKIEDKVIEKPQPSGDDKISSVENVNKDNVSPSVSSTEIATENNNVTPQTNDENAENSTKTKPTENEVNTNVSDNVTNNPVSSHEKVPEGDEHHDNSVNAESSPSPTTETNNDFNSEITNGNVSVDDPSAQDNEQTVGEVDGAPIANLDDHQIDHHTEIPTETVSSTIDDSPSVNEHGNDVTTSVPQQLFSDNNIPVQPSVVNPNKPVKTQEETKIPSGPSENSESEISPDNQVATEINVTQDSDELSKPTESPTLNTGNDEQSVLTRIPEKNNENATPDKPSQDENNIEILDQTTVYPTDSSSDKNKLNGADLLNQNDQNNVTPLTDNVETSTNVHGSGDKPIENINKDVPSENESSTLSQSQQVNQGSSENVGNVENSVTTNNYADVPSDVQSTNSPASQENNNKESLGPIVQSDKIENNVNNNQQENVKPQQNFESDDTSTQYNAVDSTTGIPIHESSSINVNNNIEASTNAPVNQEIPNEINQDSNTESELNATGSPTEKPILTDDSNKVPTNDATMEAISKLPEKPSESQTNTNEIINESTSKGPQDPNEPFVTKPSDYVIDITASSSESSNKVIFESIKPEDHENEVTTSNIDKNDDATTELYENVQPGVPGEGSCLIDFVTYPHKANVPKSNPCHEKCECLNSIVTCTSVNCPPAPPQHRNCIPLHPGNESWCCPTYMCEGGIEGMIFENHNNDGAPQLISTVVLEDKPGEENNENMPANEDVPTTSSPQILLEYNTLVPSQDDTNSGINSQDPTNPTKVSAQTEIPIKQTDDSVVSDGENIVPTTIANLELTENEKPTEHNKPVESDKLTEDDKPEESEQPSVNENPVESDKPEGNEKPQDDVQPVESDQPTENEKPIDNSEADVTTVTYAADGQTVTNRPETPINAEEQNVILPNTDNESQDVAILSTDVPNDYETTIASVLPANDQKRPEENADSGDSIAATTYKPEDSVVDQQVDNIKTNGAVQPTNNGEANVTNLPPEDVNPVEATEIPSTVADTKPTITGNNENGLRPTSIDDIINSVNMVKDAVKNSLETSSKPAEIDYQTTVGAVEDYQPTEIVSEQPANGPSSSETPLPAELPQQTTANGAAADTASELPTNAAVDDKSPESPEPATESPPSDDTAEVTTPNTSSQSQSDDTTVGVTVPSTSNQSPSAVNSEQQGAAVQTTDIPLQVLDTQEITTGPGPVIANQSEEPNVDDGNRPEDPTVDDSNNRPDVTTAQSNAAIQDSTSGVPVPQSNAEQSTNAPWPVKVDDNDESSEISTTSPAASAGPSFADDTAPEKPVTETPVSTESDDADNKTQATQVAEHTTNDDKRFGVPSSSPAPAQIDHDHDHDDNKRPQESEEMMHVPLDTETPSPKPSPIAPYSTGRPSYTPIPQSTWTQKPFHQDSSSTSEAPQQPDQGFPDEYDDENEAVYGPGTCRYGGKIYVSAQQVPRDDPCDFCFCFRGDIICLQQSCPPPIFGCYQENIQGFCCPRYECPVAQATSVNVTTTTTTTTTMVPPHFFANAYRGAARRTGCLIHGHAYRVGEDVGIASGPCLECICGADGKMACDPKPCSPEPLLRKMMAEAVDQRRR